MESRGLAFCVGAVVGLGGAVGLFGLRPQVADGSERATNKEKERIQPGARQTNGALFRCAGDNIL